MTPAEASGAILTPTARVIAERETGSQYRLTITNQRYCADAQLTRQELADLKTIIEKILQ